MCNPYKNLVKHFLLIAFVLLIWSCHAQTQHFTGGSDFQFGFARVETAHTDSLHPAAEKIQHYIDTNGLVAFDHIIQGSFQEKSQLEFPEDSTLLPEHYFVLVEKQGKLGILTSDSHWLLHPIYDTIDTRNPSGWIVKKEGFQSIFTLKGFALPFKFNEVWQMDSNYYNVEQKGKWGVYSKKDDKLVIPCIYEDMDYCYGCQQKGDYVFAKKGNKWGIVDVNNKTLIPFAYEHQHRNMTSGNMVYALYHNNTPLQINLSTGKIDTCNCGPSDYDDSTDLGGGFTLVKKDQLFGLVNSRGVQILDYKYTQITYESDASWVYMPAPYIRVCTDQGWGMADTTGKICIPPIYYSVTLIAGDSLFSCARQVNGRYKYQLVNKNGQQVLMDNFDDIKLDSSRGDAGSPSAKFLKLENHNRYGVYNPTTKVLIQPSYEDIYNFQFDTDFPHSVAIKKGGLKGILDINTGKLIIAPQFTSISTINLPIGSAIVEKQDQSGVYDYLKKKMIIPFKEVALYLTDNHKALVVKSGQKYGLEDLKGKRIADTSYDEIHSLNDSLYVLVNRNAQFQEHYQFYNSTQENFYAAPADTLYGVYADTLAILVKEGKYQLWDPASRQIKNGAYNEDGFPDFIDIFIDNRAIFYKNKKAGVLAPDGSVVVPAIYDGLTKYNNGFSLALKGKDDQGQFHYGFIDTTGVQLIPPKYDLDPDRSISEYYQDSCFVLFNRDNNGHYHTGLASKKGQVLIAPFYDKIIPQKNGSYYLIKKDNLFGVVDSLGKTLLPAQFTDIGLSSWPVYEQQYGFNFPIMAQKDHLWHYYNKDGTILPFDAGEHIPFTAPIF